MRVHENTGVVSQGLRQGSVNPKSESQGQGLVRPSVLEIKPYKPGKPIDEVAREMGLKDIIKMASNENPLGPSPRALKAVQAALKNLHLYPDGAGFALKAKLAATFKLDPACLTLGNGSSDILSFVLWAFVNEGEEILTSETTFLMYPILAKISHGTLAQVPMKDWRFDLDAMARRIGPKTKVVFLCNPNNPTGTIFRREEFEAFMRAVPEHTVVLVDEAYVEFADDKEFPDTLRWVREGKNVIALRTFSKIVGLAGLRIGYGISTPEIADWLNRVRPPFNTNTLAQVAATAALDDEAHIEKSRRMVLEGRKYLAGEFDKLGLFHVPSQANFILVQVKRDAEEFSRRLMERGVIVRSMNEFGLPDYLRVSVGTMDQNRRFISEYKKF